MLASVGLGAVDRRAAREAVAATAARIGVHVDPDARVEQLSVGERQRVEIIKALYHDCRVLILDEPTAVLTPQDVDALFATVRRLRAEGMGVVFITHKLREVVAIADRVTVLRSGRLVATRAVAELDTPTIAALMVGDAGVLAEPDSSAAVGAQIVAGTSTAPVADGRAGARGARRDARRRRRPPPRRRVAVGRRRRDRRRRRRQRQRPDRAGRGAVRDAASRLPAASTSTASTSPPPTPSGASAPGSGGSPRTAAAASSRT